MGFDLGHFINSIGTATGHALGTLPKNQHITGVDWKGIDNTVSSIGDTVKKIPIVGPLFHGILGIAVGPFAMSENILKGERIDHALVDSFKQQVGAVRDVAPYAQMVISFVPGIGTAASAAIGAGLAIAAGRPADEVAMAAVAGALPGGALASAAYNVGRSALVDKKVGGLPALVGAIGAAAGVPIPPAATAAMTTGLSILQSAANGQKVDLSSADSLIAQGQSLIPGLSDTQRTALKNALHTGLAMQHAQNLQKLTTTAVATGAPLQRLAQIGQAQAARDPVIQAARTALQGKGTTGFDIGSGTVIHRTTPFQVATVRAPLPPQEQHGFDTAAALHVGRVTAPPIAVPPAAQVGHAIAHGARTAPPEKQAALIATASSTPAGAAGVHKAFGQIKAALEARKGWLLDAGIVGLSVIAGAVIGGFPWAIAGGLAGAGADLLRRKVTHV